MAEESSHAANSHRSPYSYPQKEPNATPAFGKETDYPSALLNQIKEHIGNHGPMRFSEFMATALYDPQHGYYTAATERVGKDGDFITSVSVGRCFGLILARRILAYWNELGQPDTFHIIEPGAHKGALAADILAEIEILSPALFAALHYHLIETTPTLIVTQQKHLGARFEGKCTSHTSWQHLKGIQGVVLSNELLDALPVDLIQFTQGRWWQRMVGISTDPASKLVWENQEITSPDLATFTQQLGKRFPDGYTSEYNTGLTSFISDAAQALSNGLFITIDYGHEAQDYYHPDRTAGTLQTYHRHLKSDDPLQHPGEMDITCHVDFTRFIDIAEEHGFHHPSLKTQASYLTSHARDWLVSLETKPNQETPALLRQFQTLTHPAMLGTKFMVVEMKK